MDNKFRNQLLAESQKKEEEIKSVSRREFKYEGTYYVTEDGELYDKKRVIAQKVQRTGTSFYEVTDWEYNEERKQTKDKGQKTKDKSNKKEH